MPLVVRSCICLLVIYTVCIVKAQSQDIVPETGLNAPSDRGTIAADQIPRIPPAVTQTRSASGETAARVASGLPIVRLTPRDVMLPDPLGRGRIDLSGEWGFRFDVPATFDGTAGSIDRWDKARVPGHFSLQGFPEPPREFGVPVAWHRQFTVPSSWAGLRVRLRFESADGLARVYVNGRMIGVDERVNVPSEYDITDALVEGANSLVVTLEGTLSTYWSKRAIGGIARAVYLQAVPPVGIARLHVSTELGRFPEHGDDLVPATTIAHIRVANDTSAEIDGYSVRFSIADSGSQMVPIRLRAPKVPVGPVAPGAMMELSIPLPVDAVRCWSAEHPHLYRIQCELLDPDGNVVMTARQRFGYRQVQTRAGELLINGRAVKFRGANYHMTYPGFDYFPTPEHVRADLLMLRDMNLNVLRSRPVPMIEYLDLCDELGMYSTVEAMFTLMMYDRGPQRDHGADPSIEPALREHLAAMIESTRSNPSVVLYGLGNENPYYDYFRSAAVAMQSERLGIPLFFGSDDRLGVDIDFMDVNDDHYPRDGRWAIDNRFHIEGRGWDYPRNRPNIFSEWGHIAAINIKEYLFDPGTDDFYGFLVDLHVNWTYLQPHVVGGFLFLAAPEVKIGAAFPWRGFFDAYRRPYDMAWHVKKANSPVRIHDTTLRPSTDDPRQAAITVENRYDFTGLEELELHWSQGLASGTLRPTLPARTTREVTLPIDPHGAPALIRFTHGSGRLVDVYRLTGPHHAPQPVLPTRQVDQLEIHREGGRIEIRAGETAFGFDEDGLLVEARLGDALVLQGRPEVVARPTQFRNFVGNNRRTLINQCQHWKSEKVKVEQGEHLVKVIAAGRYTQAAGTIVTAIRADATVEVAYELEWTGSEPFNCFSWGYALRLSSEARELRWIRNAQWSVYPPDHIGRPQGIAPAGGDPSWTAARAAHREGRTPWPWSQDLLDGVTNDFRSTKFQFIIGGLYTPSGAGVTVLGDRPDRFATAQHLRASPVGGDIGGEIPTREFFPDDTTGYWLEVLEYHSGSSDPHLTKSLRHDPLMIQSGTRLSGVVRFALASQPLEIDPGAGVLDGRVVP